MKISKNLLTILLVISILFTLKQPTFAATSTENTDPVKVLEKLRIIQNGSKGITAGYLKQKVTRLDAAVMFLRLKGLESKAYVFNSKDNYSDSNVSMKDGKNLLAYIKAHPEFGFNSDSKGLFKPNNKVTAQEYYKLMLIALGYKMIGPQNTKGDFKLENTIKFASEIGLSKIANIKELTNKDLAVATMEALMLTFKNEALTLLEALALIDVKIAVKAVEMKLINPSFAPGYKPDKVYMPSSITTKVENKLISDSNTKFDIVSISGETESEAITFHPDWGPEGASVVVVALNQSLSFNAPTDYIENTKECATYKDTVLINGKKLGELQGTIFIEYWPPNTQAFKEAVIRVKALKNNLAGFEPDRENTITFTADFATTNGKKLGTNQTWSYSPITKKWTKVTV